MLSAHGLDFGFGRRVVGRGVDLALCPGEALCLLGPNGSGKTTLLRTLLGALAPLAGEVRLDGRALRGWTARERAVRLAYVPQAAESHFDFTLLELVEMGRSAHRGLFERPDARDRRSARLALERLGIAHLADRPIHGVSGGERQLALVARALATEARVIVLDEPTANLDFGNQARVIREIARLRASGIAILLCTHDPGHAFQVADRAMLLENGQVFAQGDVGEILLADNLSRLYGIGVQVAEVPTPAGVRRVCVPVAGA